MKILKFVLIIVGLFAVFLIVSNFIWSNSNETLLYKITQYVSYSNKDWKTNDENEALIDTNLVDTTAVVETDEVVS